jgi:hypothetical protein
MANEENVIDLGVWNVPTSWDEVTLKQYQEIERYYEGKDEHFDVRKVLNILTNHTEDEINMLPLEYLEEIMEKLNFLSSLPKEEEPRNWCEINGERYSVHTEQKLKTGEYIASDTALKGDKHNYAAIMAVLCRKDGELYDSHFENEVLEGRIKLFEEQPVTKILPIISFFLRLYAVSMMPTLLSLEAKETIDHTRKDIETLQKSGGISKRSMKSAMKKLRKLEKSINTI